MMCGDIFQNYAFCFGNSFYSVKQEYGGWMKQKTHAQELITWPFVHLLF